VGWAALIFAAATAVLSYPLALHPASLSRLDNGDARLNAWAISWVAHQVVQDPLRLFEANTFHPLPHSLAYSENLTALGIMALPLLAATDDLVLTNNLLLLFSMFAAAMAMYWLAQVLTGSHVAAVLAGFFFSFATFRFNRLPHLQLQFYAFLPLFLASWHLYLAGRRLRHLALVGLFFVLQALAGTYLGAMSAVALGIAVATLLPLSRPSGRDALRIAALFAVIALALVPFVRPYLWVHRVLGVEWDLPGVGSLSATPASYLASSSHLYGALSEHVWRDAPPRDYLFPGLTLLLLGAVGIVLLARERGRRPVLLCYAAILVLGFVISLGPATDFYSLLYRHVVFFRGLRALTRFSLLPLLSLSVFSAVALAWLLDEKRGLARRKLVAWAIGIFFAAESTAIPYHLEPFRDEVPEVYSWLSQARPGPIVELPFRVIDTQYMFWARHHDFRPMLNGDSGFIPASHQWMRSAFLRFPSDDSIALLRRLRVRYVIVHLAAFREGALLRTLKGIEEHRSALVPVRDFGRDLVFEVAPEASAPSVGPPLLPLRASGSEPRLFDSNLTDVVRAEGAEHAVELELADGAEMSALRLHYGPTPRVPAERIDLRLEQENGGVARSTPPSWPALAELVEGLVENPSDGSQTFMFPPVSIGPGARARVTIHGIDGEPPELTEIEVLGAASADRVPAEDGKPQNGLEPDAPVEPDRPLVVAAHHQRQCVEAEVEEAIDAMVEEPPPDALTLERGRHRELGEMGLLRRSLGDDRESHGSLRPAVPGDDGCGGNRGAAAAMPQNVGQESPASLGGPVHLVHPGVGASGVSALHQERRLGQHEALPRLQRERRRGCRHGSRPGQIEPPELAPERPESLAFEARHQPRGVEGDELALDPGDTAAAELAHDRAHQELRRTRAAPARRHREAGHHAPAAFDDEIGVAHGRWTAADRLSVHAPALERAAKGGEGAGDVPQQPLAPLSELLVEEHLELGDSHRIEVHHLERPIGKRFRGEGAHLPG
jgi:hypothetical protein